MKILDDDLIACAEHIARTMHEGQVDKLGVPYIEHVEAVVALCMSNWPSEQFKTHGITVAWLHDVVEDTEMTLETLSTWFPRSIISAVHAITHKPGEPRPIYYARCGRNWIARHVKMQDVAHNQSRLHLIENEATRERLTLKYLEAEICLEMAG